MEFDLLAHLVKHPHRAWRRLELLDAVWGGRHSGVRTVDVHVRRLRVKAGPLITTVPGVGYRLADDAGAAIMRQR
jgi:DNA-binding response OmpR family regulator